VGTTPSIVFLADPLRKIFCAGKAHFAESFFAEFEHFLRRGRVAVGTEGFDAAVDGGSGFAGNGW